MSVHYKFKSTLDYDTVSFDGLHISVHDLKKAIFHQKRIGKNTDFDLQITNAQTKEDYMDDNALIAKNTSLIISRVPLTVQQKRSRDRSELQASTNTKDESNHGHTIDLMRLDGTEDDKIRAMMSQSTQDYDPSNYIKIRGTNQTGDLPPNYLCYKCHQPGHWIKNCPLGVNQESIEIKKSTGIPRSFMVPVEGPLVPGAMMTPTGHYAVPAIDHQAYREGKKERPPFFHDPEPTIEKPEIPEDLLCTICKDLLTDAVMIPCCGNSFCDECIRTVLLESEEHECPDCNEKDVSPETLIPNRFLRNAVMTFKNETGYAKRQILRSTISSEPVEEEKSEVVIAVSQSEVKESPEELPVTQSNDPPVLKDPPQILPNADAKDPNLESKFPDDTLPKSTSETEIEAVPPVPPGTETSIPISSTTKSPKTNDNHNVLPAVEKKDCEKEYIQERCPRERRPSFNREAHHERVETLRSTNRRRSLSPKQSHQSDYSIHNASLPQLMKSTKEYQNLPSMNTSRYTSNVDYESEIQNTGEDRPGTPTIDEPHLHQQLPMNHTPLLPYPVEDRIPIVPLQNYNQPPHGRVSHNQPLLPDPYMSHRMPIYSHQQGSHYGPPRYDRPQYQQPRFRPNQPTRVYNGLPRPLRGMLHHRSYRGIQPQPPPPQPTLPPPPPAQPLPLQSQSQLSLPSSELVRNLHNGNNPGIIDDPLAAFEQMLREKDERDRRLGKHRRRTRSRSRTRSYSRSRSRSFGRRSPLSSCISRSRSPMTKRRSSRSPLPLKQRSRTPKRRSRSGSFSISRSRSYSRSQSPRRSISRERERECDRDRERNRDWDRDAQVRYRSPFRSPLRIQNERDRDRARSRESREGYNVYYNESQSNDYGSRDRDRDRNRDRDLPSRERPSCRYTSRSLSTQHNIPPLLPHLSTGAHPPPLMSLGAPQLERKDYYDSYNRYTGPSSQRYNSPIREGHYKRFDDVAPPGTEGYYDIGITDIKHPQRLMKDDRDRNRLPKELENRSENLDIDNHDRLQLRDERFCEHESRTREREERDRRGVDRDRDREREKEKDERDRMFTYREREDRMREKDSGDRRDKDKDRDTEKYIRDRRDDDRQTERKDYDKEKYRNERDHYRNDDKGSRTRNRDRKERGHETEKDRERQDRQQRRSVDRKKTKKTSSPHLQKQRSDIEPFSPERLKKKDKDYHEDKSDEKKKEKRIRDKKKKKDSEEKEKKKKKKKDKKLTVKEVEKVKIESSKSLSEPEISSVGVMKTKNVSISNTKTHDDIEPNHIELMDNSNTLAKSSHIIEFDEKSLIMNPEPPELSEQKLSRQADAELSRNPTNPNFKPIPELKTDLISIDNLYDVLDSTKIDDAMTEKYSQLSNNENEDDNKDIFTDNNTKPTLTPEPEITNSDEMPTVTLQQMQTNDINLPQKSPKKDEFLAPMPELSKWERDDTNVEKLEETTTVLSIENKITQDDSKSTKVVTSEVLKRAENAIFQKAINAIRPIEIKKISDSRKILYQNPETKNAESGDNREIRKNVNVTVNIGKNERNIEITEPFKKSKLDRSKLKTSSENYSPTRLSLRERLGEKIEDDKNKITIPSKPFLDKRNVNKNDNSNRCRSPKLTKEKGLSPLIEPCSGHSLHGNSNNTERKIIDDRKQEREKCERSRERNYSRCEKSELKVEKDIEISNLIDFRSGRTDRNVKERERDRDRERRRENDRDTHTPQPTAYKHETSVRLNLLKRKNDDDDGEKKDDKTTRGEKKRKKEHESSNKSRDRKKRKEKKRKKEKNKIHEKKPKQKDNTSVRDHSQFIEDKHNIEKINQLSQDEQSTKKQRKIPRLTMDRKRTILDEASFEPDYSALESESDSEHNKLNTKKSKLIEQHINVNQQIEMNTTKQTIKSTSSDDDSSSSASSSTISDSSDDSRRKRKNKHKKHKKRKSTKKNSSSDSDSDSDSTDSSSDGEKHKKRSKKSKNKSKQSKRKRKSKHK